MTAPASEPKSGVRAYWYLAAGLWLFLARLVLAAWLMLPDWSTGAQCDVSSSGCSLAPADRAIVAGTVAAPFLAIAGLLGMALLGVLRSDPAFVKVAPSLQALAVLTVLGMVAAAVTVALVA